MAGKSQVYSVGATIMTVTIITMVGKSSASMGAIRKVRFQEKPDSVYRAVSCSDEIFQSQLFEYSTLYPHYCASNESTLAISAALLWCVS